MPNVAHPAVCLLRNCAIARTVSGLAFLFRMQLQERMQGPMIGLFQATACLFQATACLFQATACLCLQMTCFCVPTAPPGPMPTAPRGPMLCSRVHVLTIDVCARGGCASTWVNDVGRIGVNAGVKV